jgi:nucleotide-binding universal stress UspA family protein
VSVYDLNQLWEATMSASPEIFESLEKETKKLLTEAQQEANAVGMASECHFLQGSVVEQIVLLAERLDANLVVMGHQYVSGLRRLLERSAAKALIDESPCSVMIVRDDEVASDSQ